MSNENNENNIENSNFYIESEENKYNTNQDNENIINKKDNDNEKTKKLEIEIPKNFQNSKEREFYEAAQSYLKLKNQIDKIINSSSDKLNDEQLLEENSKILNIYFKLNNIMTKFTKRAPWLKDERVFLDNKHSSEIIKNKMNLNNIKLLENYKIEYDYLDNKLKILGDLSHKNYLTQEKELLKQEIEYYENEINNLKKVNEINDILMTKKLENPYLQQMILNRFYADYESKEESYKLLNINCEKNKNQIEANDNKIKELLKLKEELDKMAKELYNITEYINIKEYYLKKEEDEKNLNRLKKNNEILINAFESLNRKNERQIKNFDIKINSKKNLIEKLKKELEDNIDNLNKMINENNRLETPLRELQKLILKLKKMRKTQGYIDFINNRRREERERKEKELEMLRKKQNRFQSQSFDRMFKKFSEKGINNKKYNFNFENDYNYDLRGLSGNNSKTEKNTLYNSYNFNVKFDGKKNSN